MMQRPSGKLFSTLESPLLFSPFYCLVTHLLSKFQLSTPDCQVPNRSAPLQTVKATTTKVVDGTFDTPTECPSSRADIVTQIIGSKEI